MTIRHRLIRHLSIAALLTIFGFGCTRVEIEYSGGSTSQREGAAVPTSLSIRQFEPISSLIDKADSHKTTLARIEARLFSVYLRRTLADSGVWPRVYTISGEDRPDAYVLEGRVTGSRQNGLEVEVHVSYAACDVEFSRVYESSFGDDPEVHFREISALMLSELTDRLSRVNEDDRDPACMLSATAPNSDELDTGKVSGPFTEIISETVETYWDIYYEDLIGPFTEFRNSDGGTVDSLLEREQRISEELLQGVAATTGAVLTRCTTESPPHDAPLHTLLEVKPFSRYSNFQTVRSRTELLRQARELGLVIDEQTDASSPKLNVDDRNYVLEGSVQEQNSKWRRMIADVCGNRIQQAPDT